MHDLLQPAQIPVYSQMDAIVNPHVPHQLAPPLNPYGPQAQPPLEVDPWEMQSGYSGHPLTNGYPYDQRQMMALAFQQYIQTIQRRLMDAMSSGRGAVVQSHGATPTYRRVPSPNRRKDPGMTQGPGVVKTATGDGLTETPSEPTAQDTHSIGNDVNAQKIPELPADAGFDLEPAVDPQTFPAGNRGDYVPTMPSGDELQRMSECRVLLEPRITMCLKDAGHDLTLEHFMSPQFINTAREVCIDSDIVGQCIMRQDVACGDGPNIEMTRKMIDSVLQMMGMVCAQINAIDNKIPSVAPPIPEKKRVTVEDITKETEQEKRGILLTTESPVTFTQKPDVPKYVKESKSNKGKATKLLDKFTTSKPHHTQKESQAVKAASKSEASHHSIEAVSTNSLIPGAPLWLIIAIGSVIILLVFVALVLLTCLACRRRRLKKEAELNKEFERKPELLDAKLYTIGIPPPTYPIATIKTQDEFCLPPLDLCDDEKNLSDLGEEAGADDDIKKPPISDDDADDESEDHNEDEKKKREKKEKK